MRPVLSCCCRVDDDGSACAAQLNSMDRYVRDRRLKIGQMEGPLPSHVFQPQAPRFTSRSHALPTANSTLHYFNRTTYSFVLDKLIAMASVIDAKQKVTAVHIDGLVSCGAKRLW